MIIESVGGGKFDIAPSLTVMIRVDDATRRLKLSIPDSPYIEITEDLGMSEHIFSRYISVEKFAREYPRSLHLLANHPLAKPVKST